MGKTGKRKFSKVARHQPLLQQIEESTIVSRASKKKAKVKDDTESKITLVDPKLTKRILDDARKQQEELEEEYSIQSKRMGQKPVQSDEENDDEVEDETDDLDTQYAREEDGSHLMADMHISDEDARALEMFMAKEPAKRKTLGEIIAEKLAEREAELQTTLSDVCSVQCQKLDSRIYDLYRGVKEVMSKYRAGKVPKAFKVIPSFNNWEQILYLTDPDSWTAASMYAATRIFTTGLKDKMAQRFFNLVLLPRVRDDIGEYKRLNYHLYQALRKALFRPGAFFKGIVLPLVEGGDCTLREAVIISSVIAKNSVPVLHASAALLKMSQMPYSGSTSVFMHTLLNKKYALPYMVVDGMVEHLLRFEKESRDLPVLWHQVFLIFVKQCANDLTAAQKDALLGLTQTHRHRVISDLIRKELFNAKCRRGGEEEKEATRMDC